VPKLSRRRKILLIVVAFIGLVAVGSFLYRIPEMANVELAAEGVTSIGGYEITNTMLTAWVSILVLVGISYAATRKMKLVPTGLQNAVEAAIETLLNFVTGVAGKENGRKFFPIIATIFLFVMANAWLALLPGYGMFGPQHTKDGEIIIVPILRAVNTDINFPLALAIISFVFVEYWGIKTHGLSVYTKKFFNVSRLKHGMGQLVRGKIRNGLGVMANGIIDAFAGFIEAITEIARIMSFTFRLFGNMTAGELLLLVMMFLIPWGAAIPFYGLELFIGLVQALIFAGLTLVFVVMAVAPREEH
jgi:F-type H+-transporting ATPase subunit a